MRERYRQAAPCLRLNYFYQTNLLALWEACLEGFQRLEERYFYEFFLVEDNSKGNFGNFGDSQKSIRIAVNF